MTCDYSPCEFGEPFQVTCPVFLQAFSEGRNFFLEVFATLAHKCSKTHGKKFHPMSLVQLLLRPSPWVVFFVFMRFLQPWPKNAQNQWKNKKTKNKKNTPCHLSSFSSDPLHGSIFLIFVFYLGGVQGGRWACFAG